MSEAYINPFVDFSFKRIFASESSKGMLKAFLNEVMAGHKLIEKIEYRKNEYPGEIHNEGGAILDVVCTDQDGGTFLIEVQRVEQAYFKERALFYTSRLISEQAPKGNRKAWAYNLKEVYLIALLEDFNLPESTDEEYLHNICLSNRDTGKIFYRKLGFTYIEMRNFVKTESELKSMLDKWLYALKNLNVLESKPQSFIEPEFEELFNLAKYTNLTKEERDMYNNSQKVRWDNQNARDFAEKKGHEQGLQRGLTEGLTQGLQRGLTQGNHEKAVEVAISLKEKGIAVHIIAESTKLSVGEVDML